MNDSNGELSKSEQERIGRQKGARSRKARKFIMWVLALAVVAAGIYGLVFWSKKMSRNKPGDQVPEMASRDHLPPGSPRPDYNSNPPTSGNHYAQPANWGIYAEPLPDEQLVHNLEHGGIWISYRDQGNAELAAQLKSIAEDYTLKVIITPRPQNDSQVAVAAWGRLLKLENFDEEQIRGFIGAYINRGPEQVPF